jgi:hypothetical protein
MATRRSFIGGMAGGFATLASSRELPPAIARPAGERVRRSIADLDPGGPEIRALRAGVAAMKKLDPAAGSIPTDVRSWGYQRAIHNTPAPGGPLPTAWNTCPHHAATGAFLAWHRAYLHFFERICRAASGDSTFALPYWNYDLPGQNALPWVFAEPDDTTNPLWHAPRGIRAGDSIDPAAIGEDAAANHADYRTFAFTIERCHDNTHGAIGGHMSRVAMAALDPIFYLHHCNIDRVWRKWQRRHQPTPPTPPPPWWTMTWTFFDENGEQVQVTGKEIESTIDLGYSYDDESPLLAVAPRAANTEKIRELCSKAICGNESQVQTLTQPQQGSWPIALTAAQPAAALPVRIPAASVQSLWQLKRDTGRTLNGRLLSMELILEWSEGAPLIAIETRPRGTQGSAGWIRAGTVSSFGRGGNRDTVRADLSQVLDSLTRGASAAELEWRVRLTSGLTAPDGTERPTPAGANSTARVWSARLFVPE